MRPTIQVGGKQSEHMMTGTVARIPRAEQWAESICTQLGKSVDSIIEVGRLLVKAKAELPRGEWGRMFEDELVPFSIGTAERLMAVAEHPVLSNSAHGRNLPPSWRTLYELSRVPAPELKSALRDGRITTDMQRKAVVALMPVKPSSRNGQDQVLACHDEGHDVMPEPPATPKEYRDAFFMRVGAAMEVAHYPEAAPVTKEMVEWAHRVVVAWTKLAKELEGRL